eukprot:1348208-Amorphochlora_amoeboformis.AAC.1
MYDVMTHADPVHRDCYVHVTFTQLPRIRQGPRTVRAQSARGLDWRQRQSRRTACVFIMNAITSPLKVSAMRPDCSTLWTLILTWMLRHI